MTVSKCPASQLTCNERVAEYLLLRRQRLQLFSSRTEMMNPHGRGDQDHAGRAKRRLRIGRSPVSVPASSAKRRALALATRASKPRRTSEVFSFTPVSLAA